MKKLMIAAVVCLMAVASQAAAVTWQWGSTIYNGYKNTGSSSITYDGKAAQAGTMYIFNGDATSQQAVLTTLLAGNDISSLAMDSYTTTDGTMGSDYKKTLADPYTEFSPTHKGTGASAEKDYAAFFYAMVVDDNIYLSDSFNTQLQTAKDTSLSGGTVTVSSAKFQGDAADGFTAGGWYAMAVPEPTSGLLLLLGVAGLALRRRRA